MGESGNPIPDDLIRVWTVVVTGGYIFRLALLKNPPLEHDGIRTLWKLVGPEELAMRVAEAIRILGSSVSYFTEYESAEQYAERLGVLGSHPIHSDQ